MRDGPGWTAPASTPPISPTTQIREKSAAVSLSRQDPTDLEAASASNTTAGTTQPPPVSRTARRYRVPAVLGRFCGAAAVWTGSSGTVPTAKETAQLLPKLSKIRMLLTVHATMMTTINELGMEHFVNSKYVRIWHWQQDIQTVKETASAAKNISTILFSPSFAELTAPIQIPPVSVNA